MGSSGGVLITQNADSLIQVNCCYKDFTTRRENEVWFAEEIGAKYE